MNVVPYPQLRFFVPGYVETELKVSPGAVSSMTKEMFDNKNILINCNLANERFFTVGAIFRGQLSPKVSIKKLFYNSIKRFYEGKSL